MLKQRISLGSKLALIGGISLIVLILFKLQRKLIETFLISPVLRY